MNLFFNIYIFIAKAPYSWLNVEQGNYFYPGFWSAWLW